MHVGESGFHLHAVQVFQRLKREMLPGNLMQIMFPVCFSVALPGASYYLTRGCLQTETKKHSCHSFTLSLLSFDQRARTRSHWHAYTNVWFIVVLLQSTFLPEGFSSKRVHLCFYFIFQSHLPPTSYMPGVCNLWPRSPWQHRHAVQKM